MLNERQLARLDETIRRLIVEIGRRENGRGSSLTYTGDSCKEFALALEILVNIKRSNNQTSF